MLEWLEKEGAKFNDIEVRQSRKNLMRGVYAKRDISIGETIIFVPYNALFETYNIFSTPLGDKLKSINIISKDTDSINIKKGGLLTMSGDLWI